ncbi:MAG: hypothetical protein HOV81_00575 [Kofleriaceae bacterium]|nr:hypothetical protein [Kofleriaceae bacterium]
MTSRSLVPIGALAIVAACKLDSLSVRTLRIRPTGSTSPIATMAAGAPTYVASDADLASVRELCANDLTAELDAPNPRAAKIASTTTFEVELFGRRPNEMHDFLASLDESGISAALRATASQRANGVWHPDAATPSGFPMTPTIASASTGTLGSVSTRALASDQFWGTGPMTAGVPAEVTTCRPSSGGANIPGGSVQGVIAYNRGLCSQETSYAEILADGHRQLVDKIHGATKGGIGSNTIEYSILSSYVRHEGAVLDAPVGGVMLLLRVVSRDLLGNVPGATWGKVRYDLGLSSRGTVEIRPKQLGWRHDEGWGRIFSEGLPGLAAGLRVALTANDGELVTTLQAMLLDKQLLGVRSTLAGAAIANPEFDCKPEDYVATCGKAATALANNVIGPGLTGRMTSGSAPLFTADEIDRMRCAIGDATSCTKLGKDAAAIVRDRWVCRKSTNHCDMIIPIRRLLPTPDGMIAVFFDEDDFDNPAYVLEAAAPGAMCAPANPPASRRFISNVVEDGGPTS